MASSSICFTWGHYFPGREEKGMACFEEARKYLDDYRPMLTDVRFGLATQGNFTSFAGYLIATGPEKDIDNILGDDHVDGFQDRVSFARRCVFNLSVVKCDTVDKLAARQARAKKTRDRANQP